MSSDPNQTKQQELQSLRQRIATLEAEIDAPPEHWEASGFYASYYATTGFLLGIFGAATSLLFNIVGSAVVGQHPLRLIQIYLTFPLGEKALSPEFDSGITLAVGCCLYLGTGMLLGIPFQLTLGRFDRNTSLPGRLVAATIMSLTLWLINFYGILYWLQPLLFDGRWIVEMIPWWVAATTHLVFGWTMAFVYPLGVYRPYYRQSEKT